MRYDIKTFGENYGVRIATVHLNGQFGFKEGSAVWDMCRPEQQRCQVYYFNLAELTAVEPEGLTWLQLFLCWARESGRSVRFINTPAELCRRLSAAGIQSDGTAADKLRASPMLPRTRSPVRGSARLQDLADALRGAAAREKLLHCD
jgi:ABC-type transporter Mla MlaB component